MPVEYDEFKGYKLIVLKRTPQDNYPFKFGKSKARLIAAHLDAIKAFVADEEVEDKDELVSFDEFKGHKLIVLKRTPQDNYPFKFGKSKAQLIVDNAEEIKSFAAETDEKKSNS